MRRKDLETLFDFSYWTKNRVLECAAKLTRAEFQAPSGVTTRDLRGTLVHTLDVEWSWRARLQGKPEAVWKKELRATDYPTAKALIDHWQRDEQEMKAWLATLDDERLGEIHDLTPGSPRKERFPLWYYVLHIHTHTQQQLSDAAVLLTRMRQSPGNIDFLDFADHLHRHERTPAD
ncbi:MAG: DinB family protein [Candidatus Limnocylindria bacterium]